MSQRAASSWSRRTLRLRVNSRGLLRFLTLFGESSERQAELARQSRWTCLPAVGAAFDTWTAPLSASPSQPTEGRIAIVLGSVSRQGLPTSVVVGLLLGVPAPSMLPVALGSQGLRVHLTELRAPKE
jgi:hypothetical protein